MAEVEWEPVLREARNRKENGLSLYPSAPGHLFSNNNKEHIYRMLWAFCKCFAFRVIQLPKGFKRNTAKTRCCPSPSHFMNSLDHSQAIDQADHHPGNQPFGGWVYERSFSIIHFCILGKKLGLCWKEFKKNVSSICAKNMLVQLISYSYGPWWGVSGLRPAKRWTNFQ